MNQYNTSTSKNCGDCAKKRALLNAAKTKGQSKDWVTVSVVFGTCVGSVFYVNYQPSHQFKQIQIQ